MHEQLDFQDGVHRSNFLNIVLRLPMLSIVPAERKLRHSHEIEPLLGIIYDLT